MYFFACIITKLLKYYLAICMKSHILKPRFFSLLLACPLALACFYWSASLQAQDPSFLSDSKLNEGPLVSPVQPKTRKSCLGIGVADFFLPGVGYLANGEYGKLATISALRWFSIIQALYPNGLRYLEPQNPRFFEGISGEKVRDSVDIFGVGHENLGFRYLYDSLTYFSIWDFVESKCAKDPTSPKVFLAPFRFKHFYKKAVFIAPMAYLLGKFALHLIEPQKHSASSMAYRDNYYEPLSESQYYRHHVFRSYSTSIGEELLFRGIVQKQLYQIAMESFRLPERWARYLAIFSSASLYALAHRYENPYENQVQRNYNPIQASFSEAFLAGLVLGWSFQSKPKAFDIITPIALHYWWNTLIGLLLYQKLGNADGPISVPIMSIQYSF